MRTEEGGGGRRHGGRESRRIGRGVESERVESERVKKGRKGEKGHTKGCLVKTVGTCMY